MRAKNLFLTESLVRLKLWVEEEMGFGSIEQELIDHIMFSVEETKDYAEN
jgi:hypothetical protein